MSTRARRALPFGIACSLIAVSIPQVAFALNVPDSGVCSAGTVGTGTCLSITTHGQGAAISATSQSNVGVQGSSTTADGIFGSSGSGFGVDGQTASGVAGV